MFVPKQLMMYRDAKIFNCIFFRGTASEIRLVCFSWYKQIAKPANRIAQNLYQLFLRPSQPMGFYKIFIEFNRFASSEERFVTFLAKFVACQFSHLGFRMAC